MRLGAFAWLLAIQFFVAQAVVAWAWTNPFSLATNYISDLGNTACGPHPAGADTIVCSPWHVWMNVSLVLVGITMAVGAALTPDAFNRGWMRTLGLALIAIAGLGAIVVGLFPENENITRHAAGAGINLVAGNLGLFVLGRTGLTGRPARGFETISVAAGVIGLAATGLFAWDHRALGLGAGTLERIAAYPITLWQVCAGAVLLRRSGERASSVAV